MNETTGLFLVIIMSMISNFIWMIAYFLVKEKLDKLMENDKE